RLARQRAGFFEGARQFAGLDLARFHIGLIERIDAQNRSGGRGRNFEAEKFLDNMRRGILHQANHRMAGGFELLELELMLGIALAFERKIDKEAIVAIEFCSTEWLAIDRDQAFAVLAGRLGE